MMMKIGMTLLLAVPALSSENLRKVTKLKPVPDVTYVAGTHVISRQDFYVGKTSGTIKFIQESLVKKRYHLVKKNTIGVVEAKEPSGFEIQWGTPEEPIVSTSHTPDGKTLFKSFIEPNTGKRNRGLMQELKTELSREKYLSIYRELSKSDLQKIKRSEIRHALKCTGDFDDARKRVNFVIGNALTGMARKTLDDTYKKELKIITGKDTDEKKRFMRNTKQKSDKIQLTLTVDALNNFERNNCDKIDVKKLMEHRGAKLKKSGKAILIESAELSSGKTIESGTTVKVLRIFKRMVEVKHVDKEQRAVVGRVERTKLKPLLSSFAETMKRRYKTCKEHIEKTGSEKNEKETKSSTGEQKTEAPPVSPVRTVKEIERYVIAEEREMRKKQYRAETKRMIAKQAAEKKRLRAEKSRVIFRDDDKRHASRRMRRLMEEIERASA